MSPLDRSVNDPELKNFFGGEIANIKRDEYYGSLEFKPDGVGVVFQEASWVIPSEAKVPLKWSRQWSDLSNGDRISAAQRPGTGDQTSATTKQFLQTERRLLPSFLGFVISGRLMFVHPLDHTLRGFHFDPSAFGKKDFYVNAFFMPLYVPTECAHFTFGRRVNRRQGWRADQTDLDVALKSEMQREAPFLAQFGNGR